jgi:hypothetical protein
VSECSYETVAHVLCFPWSCGVRTNELATLDTLGATRGLGDCARVCVWVPEEGFESAVSPSIVHLSSTYENARSEISVVSTRNAESVAQPMAQSECGLQPIETALGQALLEASKAGQWAIVAQLAKELEARRLEGSPNVVRLPDAKLTNR